jgi:ABC-type sugar transport system ATPase subunit
MRQTTSLRMVAGLEQVSSGAIYIGERNVTQLAPKTRDAAPTATSPSTPPHPHLLHHHRRTNLSATQHIPNQRST